jgi:DNA-binding MarR family transcriptional regulator
MVPQGATGDDAQATTLVSSEWLENLAVRVRLHRTEWRVLAIILSSPRPVSASSIAKRLRLDYGLVKRAVREMARWNMVERTSAGLAFQPDHNRWGPPRPHHAR